MSSASGCLLLIPLSPAPCPVLSESCQRSELGGDAISCQAHLHSSASTSMVTHHHHDHPSYKLASDLSYLLIAKTNAILSPRCPQQTLPVLRLEILRLLPHLWVKSVLVPHSLTVKWPLACTLPVKHSQSSSKHHLPKALLLALPWPRSPTRPWVADSTSNSTLGFLGPWKAQPGAGAGLVSGITCPVFTK